MMIPTPGRVVWYRPGKFEGISHSEGRPLAAIIAHVWTNEMVNLTVFDSNGNPQSRTSIQLRPETAGDVPASGASHWEWMPYQKGQAAKNDQDVATMRADLDTLIDYVAAVVAAAGLSSEDVGFDRPAPASRGTPYPDSIKFGPGSAG